MAGLWLGLGWAGVTWLGLGLLGMLWLGLLRIYTWYVWYGSGVNKKQKNMGANLQKKLSAYPTRGGRAPGRRPLRSSGVLQPRRAFDRGRDGEEQRQDLAAGGGRGAAGGDHASGARGALVIPAIYIYIRTYHMGCACHSSYIYTYIPYICSYHMSMFYWYFLVFLNKAVRSIFSQNSYQIYSTGHL